MKPQERIRINLNPLTIGIAMVVIAFVGLLIYTLTQIFRGNPYGTGLKIDNISQYAKNLPRDTQDSMFAMLYKTVASNLSEGATIPAEGAKVRDNTANEVYDDNKQITYGSFIVDIASLRQSYEISYEWSSVENNTNLSGYQIVISCPEAADIIYEDFECTDMFSDWNGNAYDSLSFILPHTMQIETGDWLSIKIAKYLNNNRYVDILVETCKNDSEWKEQAKAAVEGYIAENRLEPSNYEYYFRKNCLTGV